MTHPCILNGDLKTTGIQFLNLRTWPNPAEPTLLSVSSDDVKGMLAKEIKFIERFKARASHAAQVQSRVKKLDKIERVEPPRRPINSGIIVPGRLPACRR